jgi:hypothetical protein
MAPTLAALPAPPRSGAVPHTGAVQPPLASCAVRRAARHAEIARDAQVVAEALRDTLRRILEAALPAEQLWVRVGEAVAASRVAHRTLNDARITLRARRSAVYADSAPLPASLAFYRHHGNYRGAFVSMAELGNCLRGALGITAGLSPLARAALARELHLRGDVWTLEHEGAVHVFGRPGSGADLILACERPWPDDLSPTLAPLEARTS